MDVRVLEIPFVRSFSHASAVRAETETIWVAVSDGDGTIGYGEGCPRAYVTGETISSCLEFLERWSPESLRSIGNVSDLVQWLSINRAAVDANPAAACALELALLDLLAKRARQSVERLIGRPSLSGAFRYTAVIGAGEAERFAQELMLYRQAGFVRFKIKLSGMLASDRRRTESLHAAGIHPSHVRADANNLWPGAKEAIHYLAALDYPFAAIEEPVRAGDYDQMRLISEALGYRLVLDESMLRLDQVETIGADPDRWIVNLRVSKLGGLLRSLELLDSLRTHGLKVIVGAQVGETSLLTRAGLSLAAAAGDILEGQEGAVGTHLLAYDIADPPLMFGRSGIIDAAATDIAHRSGWGLDIRHEALDQAARHR